MAGLAGAGAKGPHQVGGQSLVECRIILSIANYWSLTGRSVWALEPVRYLRLLFLNSCLLPPQVRQHPWFQATDWQEVRSRRLTPPIVPKVSSHPLVIAK